MMWYLTLAQKSIHFQSQGETGDACVAMQYVKETITATERRSTRQYVYRVP